MRVLVKHVKLFDGISVREGTHDVLFDESGILAVGNENPADADTVIDGTGKTLLPGLIDGHVHLGSLTAGMDPVDTDKKRIQTGAKIAAQAQEVWRCGITTMCNCGTGANADIYVRDLIRSGLIPGCRIVACGRAVCITGGHGGRCKVPLSRQSDGQD